MPLGGISPTEVNGAAALLPEIEKNLLKIGSSDWSHFPFSLHLTVTASYSFSLSLLIPIWSLHKNLGR